jgi:hypothetical protein
MTKLEVGQGSGHRRATALIPPRWLRPFPPVWWALVGWCAGSPVGHGLTGSVTGGGPEPLASGSDRSTAAGLGGGATPWGVSVAPPPVLLPVEPAPAASAESRQHSLSFGATTRKRVVLLPHAPTEPTDTRPFHCRTLQ